MKRSTKRLAKRHCKKELFAVAAALLLNLLIYLLPLMLILPRAQSTAVPEAYLPAAEEKAAPKTEHSPSAEAEKAESKAQTKEKSKKKADMELRCLLNGTVQRLKLEDYLWGVVAAEMPASFEQEALCAQAVAARTYTLYRMANPTPNHPDADICGDPGCCQAWMSREERLEGWSKSERKACEKKIDKAITKTSGQALYYDDVPIMAAFHAASAGSTKSAKEVWGEECPYLQEVPSPEDDSIVPNYYSTVTLSKKEFSDAFLTAYPDADLADGSWFGEMTYDEAGLPTSVSVGGVKVDTGRMRTMFGLRSATFSVECDEDSVTFYVTGYGHGVGMSQYGANALAKEGKTFQEILEWYYPGTALEIHNA